MTRILPWRRLHIPIRVCALVGFPGLEFLRGCGHYADTAGDRPAPQKVSRPIERLIPKLVYAGFGPPGLCTSSFRSDGDDKGDHGSSTSVPAVTWKSRRTRRLARARALA